LPTQSGKQEKQILAQEIDKDNKNSSNNNEIPQIVKTNETKIGS
jgi:hypothetical protein